MATHIWPETPFDESMFGQDIIIHCPEEWLVGELFDIFLKNGVQWMTGAPMDKTYWRDSGTETCYRVRKDRNMNYGNITCYSDRDYDGYMKCTFYGADTEDYEINEEGFLALFEAGGE